MNEDLKNFIKELEDCAVSIGGASCESFNKSVERAPLLLGKAAETIRNCVSECVERETENSVLCARIGFYKRQTAWLTDEIDRLVSEYEEKLQDLREVCDEKST